MTIRAFGESGQVCTDVVVLSTTDMHGKCWDTNVVNGEAMKNNLLRVSTAVNGIREEYGAENVLLVDNGDLFQGTPVSEVQLLASTSGKSQEPLALALCLKEIGYDAFVPGNHEFNFSWDTMSAAYRYLGICQTLMRCRPMTTRLPPRLPILRRTGILTLFIMKPKAGRSQRVK